tara:strand:- start:405 stop:584 length:180 start_codon:yes stop_codon:yes gene_type:complete
VLGLGLSGAGNVAGNPGAAPRADHMPKIASHLLEIACLTNPLGVKRVGESGAIGALWPS